MLTQLDQELIKNIALEVENKSCVFLLGAGLSIEAGLPSGADVAKMLARRASWPFAGEPLQRVADDYARLIGPVKPVIHEYLKERLADPTVGPSDAHRALAAMAPKLDNILTTNWDRLLEDVFDTTKPRKCERLYRDPDLLTRQPKKTAILKLHGDVDDPASYKVTRTDYELFAAKNPKLVEYLKFCLTSFTLVVVGYGLEDEDIRAIYLEALKGRTADEPHRLVYVVNPKEDAAWEHSWRDIAQARFVRMNAQDFMLRVYRQVKDIADRGHEQELGINLGLYPQKKPIVEFCGLRGIGKTALLTAIRKQYETSHISTVVIDLASSELWEEDRPSHLAMWKELARQVDITAPYCNFKRLAEELRKKKRIVVFIDALDRVPPVTVQWLGQNWASLVNELPELRIIVGSRSTVLRRTEWSLNLKQKVESYRLAPFQSFADTRSQMELEFLYDQELARFVFSLTLGHPGLVQYAVDWLRDRKIKTNVALEQNARTELGKYVDSLVESYIFQDVCLDLKPVIRQLALYRYFSWSQVARVQKCSISAAADFISQNLWPTGMIECDPAGNGYRVDKTVQELLRNISLISDTSGFITASATLGDQYQTDAGRLAPGWHLALLESAYHRLNEQMGRRQSGQLVDIETTLLRGWTTGLSCMDNIEGILHLREALEHDYEFGVLATEIDAALLNRFKELIERRKVDLEGASV